MSGDYIVHQLVGGPLDGQRIPFDHTLEVVRFPLPRRPYWAEPAREDDALPPPRATFPVAHYQRRTFVIGDCRVAIYHHEAMTPADADAHFVTTVLGALGAVRI